MALSLNDEVGFLVSSFRKRFLMPNSFPSLDALKRGVSPS